MSGFVRWPLRHLRAPVVRNPNDIGTWGAECGSGIRYADTGMPVPSGTPGQVRKMSQGRKAHRGLASSDYERSLR